MMATVIDPRAWYIVVNPASGAGVQRASRRSLAAALRRANVPFDCVESAAPADARGLFARAAAGGRRRLLSLGGDGTFNDLVNGLLDSGVPPRDCLVAAAAGGTGNDWSRAMEIPDEAECSRALWRAAPRARPMSASPSARTAANRVSQCRGGRHRRRVIRRTPRLGPRAVAYLAGLLATLVRYRRPGVRDHGRWEDGPRPLPDGARLDRAALRRRHAADARRRRGRRLARFAHRRSSVAGWRARSPA
jgi:diacylglycerol kinase family enzyme